MQGVTPCIANRSWLLLGCLLIGTLTGSAQHAYAQAVALPSQPIVSTEWLSSNIGDPRLVLLHVSSAANFAERHIPGARLAELSSISLSRVGPDSLSLEVPPGDDLRGRLETLGISDSSIIVVYAADNQWATHATRVLFTLDHFGLGTRSFLLDGGQIKWRAEGRPVTSAVTGHAVGTLTPRARLDNVVLLDSVAAHSRSGPSQSGAFRIVDARAGSFYDGTGRGRHRPGHIPGAVSIPFSTIFDDSLRVRPLADLRRTFAEAGVRPGEPVLAYCHIGQQATAVLFAARLLGHEARLFDGSFEQWSGHSELPVTRPGGGIRFR